MARMGMGPRIIGLFFLLILLVFGGLFWFDTLGLINTGTMFNPITSLFGVTNKSIDIEDPRLIDDMRIRKQEEALDLRFQDLDNKKVSLDTLDKQLSQKTAELDEKEKALADQEKSLNQIKEATDNIQKNLEQNSVYLTSMTPDQAVLILKGYSDQDMIDVMRKTEELAVKAGKKSLVSVWLSKLEPKRAAEIQRKMTIKPDSEQ